MVHLNGRMLYSSVVMSDLLAVGEMVILSSSLLSVALGFYSQYTKGCLFLL